MWTSTSKKAAAPARRAPARSGPAKPTVSGGKLPTPAKATGPRDKRGG